MKRILITGASGFVGSRLAELALQRGHDVRTLTRTDWAGHPAVPLANRFFGALPLMVPSEAFTGVESVIHLAAYAGSNARTANAINVDGTDRLLQLAREAGAKNFIYISSSSARQDAVSVYGRSKFEAERKVLAAKGIRVVAIRPNLVIGPGKRGVFGNTWKMVESLPVIPLLGGGKSIVQPIHVDDLCEAVFKCEERAEKYDRRVFQLGLPEGMTLASMLKAISIHALGKKKPTLWVPLWPIEIIVGIAEKFSITLPIKSANLQGLKKTEKADTGPDLQELGITLRKFEGFAIDYAHGEIPPAARSVQALLVGAGKIGPVHAIYMTRTPGMALAGTVDPNPKAAGMLRGMGVSVPAYKSVAEAVAKGGADAAVIATPVFTHLPLARECAAAGMAVMVEKPAALNQAQLEEFDALAKGSARPLAGGWVMTRNPHVVECARRLKAGEFGEVRGFAAFSLLTSVRGKPDPKRWETRKDLAGGGSWMAAGGHALSMVKEVLGAPVSINSQSLRMFSGDVEDSLAAEYEYKGFRGSHYCSWSIKGFNRLESTLVVRTSSGILWLTPAMGVFLRVDGEADIVHQVDFPASFNMAPDYAGAGFTAEFTEFARAARTGEKPPMSMEAAVSIERVLHDAYRNGKSVGKFLPVPALPEGKIPANPVLRGGSGYPVKKLLDLRDWGAAAVQEALSVPGWDGFELYPVHVALAAKLPAERVRFTVPDFLGQTRLLLSGQALGLLRQMGVGGVMGAGLAAMPLALKEKGATFWVAATGFLAAGLASIPKNFKGTLLLHPYLADLALAVRRPDRLDAMLALVKKARPWARVGFHSGMPGEAVNALALISTQVEAVSMISSPGSVEAQKWFPLVPSQVELTAEVGMAPAAAHRTAASSAGRWGHRAQAVLVGGAAEPRISSRRREEIEKYWEEAFPGLPMPDEAL